MVIILKEIETLHIIFKEHNVSDNGKKELIQGILFHAYAYTIVKRDTSEALAQDLKDLGFHVTVYALPGGETSISVRMPI